jgi:ribosome-associated protein
MAEKPDTAETEARSDKLQAASFAQAAARLCAQTRCEEVLVLDLRGVSPVTDYFVIATGSSGRQMRSVANDIAQLGKEMDHTVWQTAGTESAEWIVQDFVDVVVHLFDKKHRHFYDLELIWGDAPRLDWQRSDKAD